MSKISITPNASGTGVFTISSPATNTNRTLTLPDEAGTMLTTAGVPSSAMPAGSVLQVVNSAASTNITSTSTSYVASGHSITITPSSTSSKIFLLLNGGAPAQSTGREIYVNIYKDGTTLGVAATSKHGSAADNLTHAHSMSYLDAPNTTSAVTYEIYFKSNNGSNVAYNASANGYTFLTAMEIAG
jgi:hypothetical protein